MNVLRTLRLFWKKSDKFLNLVYAPNFLRMYISYNIIINQNSVGFSKILKVLLVLGKRFFLILILIFKFLKKPKEFYVPFIFIKHNWEQGHKTFMFLLQGLCKIFRFKNVILYL